MFEKQKKKFAAAKKPQKFSKIFAARNYFTNFFLYDNKARMNEVQPVQEPQERKGKKGKAPPVCPPSIVQAVSEVIIMLAGNDLPPETGKRSDLEKVMVVNYKAWLDNNHQALLEDYPEISAHCRTHGFVPPLKIFSFLQNNLLILLVAQNLQIFN
jgi:hypothetical protein